MILNINLLTLLIWDSFILPVDALVYIHHLGIWLVSWSPVPRWAVTEGMKKTDTSISQWSCQNHEGICKGRGSKSVFFPPQWAVPFFVFSHLIGFTVLQSYWACAKQNDWRNDCVYVWVCLWVLFCWCKWKHASVCAHLCVTMNLCVFLEWLPEVCETGVPQWHTVKKIILKFIACVENQGIFPSLLMQVVSGFLLKRCLGIRNGRGAFSYSLLYTP